MLNLQKLLRIVLPGFVPASVLLLMLAVAPAEAGNRFDGNPAYGAPDRLATPLKRADRPAVPQRELVELEELGVDNDAGQIFKAPLRLCSADPAYPGVCAPVGSAYQVPAPPRRCWATPPTGPPHA